MFASYDLSEASVSEYFEFLINTHMIVSTLLKLNDVGAIVEALAGSDKGLPAAEGALIGKRRELVARLRKMAEDPATTESDLQQVMGDAYWLFGGRYVGIADWRNIGPLDQHDIPLLCADGTLHIVELKSTNIPNLVRRHRNHWIVGGAVHEATSQAMNYLRTLDENGAALATTYRNEFGVDYDIRRAFATVVIGYPVHMVDTNARVIQQTLRSYNAHLSRVEVITYATLLDTAERALAFEDTARTKRMQDSLSSRDKFREEASEPSLEKTELDN
jgi:antiviral defense system Shedu protein SduA